MWTVSVTKFFLVCVVVIVVVCVNSATINENVMLLEKVIDSVDRLSTFFRNISEETYLDTIIGVHLAGEQLYALVAEIDDKCPEYIPGLNFTIDSIRELSSKLTAVADKATLFVAEQPMEYLSGLEFLLRKDFWKVLKPSRKTNSSMIYSTIEEVAIGGNESDYCYSEMESKKCIPSQHCWDCMTAFNKGGYYIAHELLYIQIGQSLGCQKHLNQLSDKSYGLTLDQLCQIYCSNIFDESQKIAKNGFDEDDRDLFMEQLSLCGLEGYYEFFQQPDWINEIISWQRPSGCFGMDNDSCDEHGSTVALIALQQSVTNLLKPMLRTSCPRLN